MLFRYKPQNPKSSYVSQISQNTKRNKKITLNSRLQTNQILTNNDQTLILCLFFFMNYYAWKMRAPRYQCSSHQMNIQQPWQLKKSKSWGLFWSYQLDSSANPAHLPQKWTKWAELAVLFSCFVERLILILILIPILQMVQFLI